jgi:hypothetical protein
MTTELESREMTTAGRGHRWRPATEKSHSALVSHATTTAVSSSAPVAGSAHLGSPRVCTKSTLAANSYPRLGRCPTGKRLRPLRHVVPKLWTTTRP